ncbi:MAG TPA: dihydropteroate synthase [Thermoleophilaceae bacterium]|nr:dihydropteroate synthase [Thermoleophilaceae bacterium]
MTVLRVPGRTIDVEPGRPLLMGIVNASPESFSDGGMTSDVEAQVQLAHEQIEAGAHLIDVGGESGVTDRAPVTAEEERRRVVPLVERLAADGVLVSVDTFKPDVARAALTAGAAMINDVSGLLDPELADVCAAAGAALVLMHTRARPKEKTFPAYDGPVTDDVLAFLRERMRIAADRGVSEEQIVIDPGPDFAKTPAQTVEALRHLDTLRELNRPILLAVSRKDFVGALTGRRPRERLAGSLAAIGEGVDAGASILRVHDVAEVRDFLTVRAALRGEAKVPEDLRLAEDLRRQRT